MSLVIMSISCIDVAVDKHVHSRWLVHPTIFWVVLLSTVNVDCFISVVLKFDRYGVNGLSLEPGETFESKLTS